MLQALQRNWTLASQSVSAAAFSSRQSFPADCYIVAAKRTPIGKQLGKLAKFRAPDLAGFAIQRMMLDTNISTETIDQVIMGVSLQAGVGQNPSRQSALIGGVSLETPCTTVSKSCASGLKSIIHGFNSITAGTSNCIIAGGFESMSNVPFYLNEHRRGHIFGNRKIKDGLLVDGLEDKYSEQPLGYIAEQIGKSMGFSRAAVDAVTIVSFQRALAAQTRGSFVNQIAPIQYHDANGKIFNIDTDEYLDEYDENAIIDAQPYYANLGIITDQNQSKFGDGAAACILMSESALKASGLKPLAKILGHAEIEKESLDSVKASAEAVKKVLEKSRVSIDQIGVFEISEDFATTVLAHLSALNIDFDLVNLFGGSLALGHPLGMSSARQLVNLVHAIQSEKARYGLVALPNAGGGGNALLVERM